MALLLALQSQRVRDVDSIWAARRWEVVARSAPSSSLAELLMSMALQPPYDRLILCPVYLACDDSIRTSEMRVLSLLSSDEGSSGAMGAIQDCREEVVW